MMKTTVLTFATVLLIAVAMVGTWYFLDHEGRTNLAPITVGQPSLEQSAFKGLRQVRPGAVNIK